MNATIIDSIFFFFNKSDEIKYTIKEVLRNNK